MTRRLLFLIACVLALMPRVAFAQATTFTIPPYALMPPVVVFPASAVSGSGAIAAGAVLCFGGDTGISRFGAGTLAFGNCTAADASANVKANAFVTNNGGGAFTIGGRSTFLATADKVFLFEDNANLTGLELSGGTSALGTCTGGTQTSGSHNSAGEVTGTTGGSCVINFGVPNFTNAPFCTLTDESATPTALQLSARSTASITVANITSGHSFTWLCIGRIGT